MNTETNNTFEGAAPTPQRLPAVAAAVARSSFAGTAQRQLILLPCMKGKKDRTFPSSAGGSQTAPETPAFNKRS